MATANLQRPALPLFDSAVRVPLGGKHGHGKVALLDPVDADLAARGWFVSPDGYVLAWGGGGASDRMHRVVLARMDGPPSVEGMEADHVNRNPLDNRRQNLRWATVAQNRRNRRFRSNVGRRRGLGRNTYSDGTPFYVPTLKGVNLGSYPDEETAARVWDAYASVYFGEFAALNFPADTPWTIEECERVRDSVRKIAARSGSIPPAARLDRMLAALDLPPRSAFP